MKFLLFALVGLTPVARVSAHVGYLVGASERHNFLGRDWPFLLAPIFSPQIIIWLIALVALTITIWRLSRWSLARRYWLSVRRRTGCYLELVPWIARLSLGIALIGAGVSGALISPALLSPSFASWQILLGFLFLSGFLLPWTTLAAGLTFLVAFSNDHYLFGNLDFLALVIASLLLADARPGIDDLLCFRQWRFLNIFNRWVPLLLRVGLGASFIFLAFYEKLLNPHLAAVVVSEYRLINIIPVTSAAWVLGAGVAEFILGALMVIGWMTRPAAALSFLTISLSFFYFREAVFSHITFFGALSALFVTGGGKFSLDNFFYRRKRLVASAD